MGYSPVLTLIRSALGALSHVMPIVSNSRDYWSRRSLRDVLRAVFPAGTVSGAPKIMAMEIIMTRRPCAAPTQGVGYFSFSRHWHVHNILRLCSKASGFIQQDRASRRLAPGT